MDTNATSLLAQVDRGVLALVQDLFRTASRRVRTRLVNRSGADVAVRYGTAELSSLGVVFDRLQTQEGGAFARFRLTPGDVPGLAVIQGPLLYRLVGILLGEDTTATPPLYRWRALTQVDVNIARRVFEDALGGIVEASVMPEKPRVELEAVSANPRLPFPLPRSVTVVEASLDFGPPDDPFGLLSIVLPGQASGLLWPKRTARRTPQKKTNEGMMRVLPVPVTVTAELARMKAPLSKVRELQVGSMLDLGALNDVVLRVGGRTTLYAEAGERDGVRSVRIKKRADQ